MIARILAAISLSATIIMGAADTAAQDYKELPAGKTAEGDSYFGHEPHHLSFDVDISGDMYSIGVSYHYMFCRYVGAGAGLGFWADDESEGLANLVGSFVDSDYDYDDYDYNLTGTAFYFQPSLYFRSPIIHLGRNAAVALCATPWMRISTKHHDAYPGQATDGHGSEAVDRRRTVAAGVTAGPTLRLGALGISVSYQISNMDVTRRARARGSSVYSSPPCQAIALSISLNI